MNDYKKWLEATAQYYGVTEEGILQRGKKNDLLCRARKTFYYLCFKDGLDLYRLSEALGRPRTNVIKNMHYTNNRDVQAERDIRAYVGDTTLDGLVDYWLGNKSSKARGIVLPCLIAQKQHYYENE